MYKFKKIYQIKELETNPDDCRFYYAESPEAVQKLFWMIYKKDLSETTIAALKSSVLSQGYFTLEFVETVHGCRVPRLIEITAKQMLKYYEESIHTD